MIKNLTRNRIHKSSLFIQPEAKCKVGCQGCYASGEKLASPDSGMISRRNLLDLAVNMNKGDVEFDQITLSINDLDPDEMSNSIMQAEILSILPPEKIHYACALNTLPKCIELFDLNKCSVLNISVDLNKWDKADEKLRDESCEAVTNLKKNYPHLHINTNVLIDTASEDAEKINGLILDSVADHSDSIHLVMYKSVEKDNSIFNSDKREEFKRDLEEYLKHAIAIKGTYGQKIQIDSCVKTVLENLSRGQHHACRAGVNHVSLWPENKMTGCPYRMPDSEYAWDDFGGVISFVDHTDIKDITGHEYSLCAFNRVQYEYDTFDDLCESLEISGKAIDTLKGIL